MRADLGAVLGAMGFKAKEDFIVDLAPDGLSASIRTWLSGQAQPSAGAIAAFDLAAGAVATRTAQAQKAAATASVDNGALLGGTATERNLRVLVLRILSENNILRAAILHPIVSITRSGTVATVTTLDPHGLNTGNTPRMMGATLAAYNVQATATVVNATVFTYPVAGSPATPAVGSMFFAMAPIPAMQPRTEAQLIAALKADIAVTPE